MLKSKKLLSMPIVSAEDQRHVGYVQSLVIDPEELKAAALIIDQRGLFREQKIIPYARVEAIGHDAIQIRKSGGGTVTNLSQLLRLTQERVPLVGAKVLMQSGKALGLIEEFLIDPETGRITHLEITGNFMEGLLKGRASLVTSVITAISKNVVIVNDDAEELLQKLDGGLAGLAETMRQMAETTSKMWENTVSKSREISQTLSLSLERARRAVGDEENKKDPPDHTGAA